MSINREELKEWFVHNCEAFDNCTQLVEYAVDKFDLPERWLDMNTHWIWEDALNAFPCQD
jgi:hypothetical protein